MTGIRTREGVNDAGEAARSRERGRFAAEKVMISVGLREFKARLSSYIHKVRYGEEVIVTDHGEEVASVRPLSGERLLVKSLIQSGKGQWSGGKPQGLAGVTLQGRLFSETILEERE